MREIEIKAKLRDKEAVMAKLASLGCVFEEPIIQSDVVYAENVGTLPDFLSNKVFLRLRVRNDGKVFFTLKKKDADKVVNHLASTEHEVEVSSKEETEKMLHLMGYKEGTHVDKTRIITHYDGCEICIDEVENLGTFIEMEKLVEEGDSEEIQEELFKFFESIGITRDDRLMFGYDILMLRKNSM